METLSVALGSWCSYGRAVEHDGHGRSLSGRYRAVLVFRRLNLCMVG